MCNPLDSGKEWHVSITDRWSQVYWKDVEPMDHSKISQTATLASLRPSTLPRHFSNFLTCTKSMTKEEQTTQGIALSNTTDFFTRQWCTYLLFTVTNVLVSYDSRVFQKSCMSLPFSVQWMLNTARIQSYIVDTSNWFTNSYFMAFHLIHSL